jgi:acetyl esterase/lipase
MSRRLMGLGALVAIGGLGCLVWAFVAAQAPRPTVRHESDVVFARVGGETLRADLALPAIGEGPFPAVVCLHGGGWVGGNRKQMAGTIEVLARRGYVAVAPDYRLAPAHRWPACVEDCKAAVRWLRANAGRYRVQPERIGAVGLSAGGHLACLLGVTGPADGLEGTGDNQDRPSKVQAVASFSAPMDLTAEALWTEEVLRRNLVPLFGGPPTLKMDEYRKASPARYLPAAPPPFLLVHGSADPVVPPAQAEALAGRLRQAGGAVRVLMREGERHTWAGANLTRSIDQMLTFLDEALKK